MREFYLILNAGGIVVYAPEAACFPNTVCKKIFPEFVMKAAQLGRKTFLVGANYKGGRAIEVQAEQYDPGKKQKYVVKEEMRVLLAKLSGIKQTATLEAAGLTARDYR